MTKVDEKRTVRRGYRRFYTHRDLIRELNGINMWVDLGGIRSVLEFDIAHKPDDFTETRIKFVLYGEDVDTEYIFEHRDINIDAVVNRFFDGKSIKDFTPEERETLYAMAKMMDRKESTSGEEIEIPRTEKATPVQEFPKEEDIFCLSMAETTNQANTIETPEPSRRRRRKEETFSTKKKRVMTRTERMNSLPRFYKCPDNAVTRTVASSYLSGSKRGGIKVIVFFERKGALMPIGKLTIPAGGPTYIYLLDDIIKIRECWKKEDSAPTIYARWEERFGNSTERPIIRKEY